MHPSCTHQKKPPRFINDHSVGSSSFFFCSYLAEEVIMEILSKLPVKSVLRFKSVSKSWYALIKTPHFNKKHLQQLLMNHHQNNAPLYFVTTSVGTRPHVYWISSSSSSEEEEQEVPPSINFLDSLPFSEHNPTPVTVHGPVNGVYCAISRVKCRYMVVGEESMFFFNPALREFKAIPPIPYSVQHNHSSIITYGFGYDSMSHDFKVVAINRSCQPSVFVYTLSSNSWREIDSGNGNLPAFPKNQRPGVFLSHGNGLVHWLALSSPRPADELLSFDLGTEVFKLSPLPVAITHRDPSFGIHNIQRVFLTVDDGTIYFIFGSRTRYHPNRDVEFVYTIWTMKEYGVWSKLYRTGPLLQVARNITFLKNGNGNGNGGDILFLTRDRESQLVASGARSQQIKDLNIRHPHQVVTYMESLVSINGGY